ncbi:MAG: hypothetical protein SGPRY_009173, partial [Prymnesium sp.]
MAPPMQRTLLLIKPDAVSRCLNFQIAERFEQRGFSLVACKMIHPSKTTAEAHYAPLASTDRFSALVDALSSGPAILMLFEAAGAIAAATAMLGHPDPAKAEFGTIRADFALSEESNLVECSVDEADVKRTVGVWFSEGELLTSTAPAASASPPASAAAAPSEGTSGGAAEEGGAEGEASKSKRALAKEAKKLEKQAKKEANKKQSAGIPPPPAVDKPKIEYEPPSGTRDFFPEEMRERNWCALPLLFTGW